MIAYISFFIVSFMIVYNYQNIKNMYTFYKLFKSTIDPENKKNCCSIFYDIGKIGYLLFFPPKSTGLSKFNKQLVKVPYEFRENKYFYLLKVPRGIMPIEYIKDEDGKDVLDEIYPYLGPNLDCHGANIFPKDFGLKKITIKDIHDNVYSFEEDEVIVIKK